MVFWYLLLKLLALTPIVYTYAVMVNTYVKFQTASKKLQFGNNKCKKIHMGKSRDDYKCQDLYLDKWSEKDTKDSGTEEMRIEDVCGDEEVMEEVSSERYLGHIISNDGRNISNIILN